jgi:DNA polymerase-1
VAKARRLVLIDGSWLIFRAFFAIPPHFATAAGQPTNAIYGFALMFKKLFAGRRPDLGAVAFDAPGQRHRDVKFPAYKANRPHAPRELAAQMPWIDKMVEAHGFPTIRAPGHEGDDVIGTLAAQGLAKGYEVVIVASDKDFAQLVCDGLKLFDPMKDVTYDAELVRKKWGVQPSQMVDLLALLGDDVDNIPGVTGIGQKGAVGLLTTHGSLDGIYANLDALKGKQRQVLEEQRAIAYLSRDLATIVRDVPLDRDVDALEIPEPDQARLNALYRELEFFSLLDGEHAGQDAPVVAVPLLLDRAAVDAFVAAAVGELAVVPLVDHPAPGDERLVGLAVAAPSPAYLPLGGDGPHADDDGVAALLAVLADPGRPKVAHDAKALWRALQTRGGALDGVTLDTMLASFLVDPAKNMPHRLDQVSKEFLQRTVRPLKSLVGAGQSEQAIAALPIAEAAAYAGHLAETVAALAPVVGERLTESGQEGVFRDVDLPLSWVLGAMERDGILVDRGDLERMGVEFTTRKEAIERRIYELAGHEFNVGSTQQLGTVLFEELGLPVIKKTKTGWSTDAEVLERLAPKHEIAKLLLEQRALAKLINTYTDVLRAAVSPVDGRIHATFQQTTGVSGRLISTDPDLQRTPVRTPEGRRIRQAFVAEPGRCILSADWSQIELRVLAHFSRDERLIAAFRDNVDVHRQTASELFGVAFDAVTSEQRNVGKTINFATIYGQGATALGQILGVPRKEAAAYIERYFATYSGVRSWLDRTIAEAGVNGYVTTLLGRRRIIPELSSHLPMDRTSGERIAANTPIQGSAADLCKLAMLAIARGLRDGGFRGRMLLQVHDELVFELPEAEVDGVRALVRSAMERPWPLDVPLVVNVGVGPSWGDAH